MPCIVCRKPLESSLPGSNSSMQPADAVWFSSYGQYGSTVFDPQDGSQIRINVCDACLIERQDLVWHARFVERQPELLFSQPWKPGQPTD